MVCASSRMPSVPRKLPLTRNYRNSRIAASCLRDSTILLQAETCAVGTGTFQASTIYGCGTCEYWWYESQLGFVSAMVDNEECTNIVHYGSSSCSRVARSVMAAKIFALIYGFEQTFIINYMLFEILGQEFPVCAYVDSLMPFNVVVKNSSKSGEALSHGHLVAKKESPQRRIT